MSRCQLAPALAPVGQLRFKSGPLNAGRLGPNQLKVPGQPRTTKEEHQFHLLSMFVQKFVLLLATYVGWAWHGSVAIYLIT